MHNSYVPKYKKSRELCLVQIFSKDAQISYVAVVVIVNLHYCENSSYDVAKKIHYLHLYKARK